MYVAKALQTWKRNYKGVKTGFGGVCFYTLQFVDEQVTFFKWQGTSTKDTKRKVHKLGLGDKHTKSKILTYYS